MKPIDNDQNQLYY